MYFDISPTLSAKTAVFPGDQSFEQKVSMAFSKGDHLDLSSIQTTVHIGAHTDAPSHYSKDGVSIDQRSLDYYLGSCQVVECKVKKGQRITLKDIDLDLVSEKRVLFKTNSFPDPNQWNNDFNSLSPELIQALGQKGVILVGIDTPSVDPWDSKSLESHNQIYKSDMAILEGIVLKDISPGIYKLIALPLKIEEGDASPVRAILISNQAWERL